MDKFLENLGEGLAWALVILAIGGCFHLGKMEKCEGKTNQSIIHSPQQEID